MCLHFVLQGESKQQAKPDDQWESVHLLLADADETRLHHHGRPDRHPHIPDNHRELHPPVRLLLLQSAPGWWPPWLTHLHAVQRRDVSLLMHGWGLLILTRSVPSSLRPPRHPSCHPALRASHTPSASSSSVATTLPTSSFSVVNPNPASALPAPSSPTCRTAHTVNMGSRETGNKGDPFQGDLRRAVEVWREWKMKWVQYVDRSLERLGHSLYREKLISLGEKGTFEPPLLLGTVDPQMPVSLVWRFSLVATLTFSLSWAIDTSTWPYEPPHSEMFPVTVGGTQWGPWSGEHELSHVGLLKKTDTWRENDSQWSECHWLLGSVVADLPALSWRGLLWGRSSVCPSHVCLSHLCLKTTHLTRCSVLPNKDIPIQQVITHRRRLIQL